MDAFILACLALRRLAEEKRIPEPEFLPFRLEFLRPVKENVNEPLSPAFDQSGEAAIV
jgi:hypothetical protein